MSRESAEEDRSVFDPIPVVPVAVVRGGRTEPDDDSWGREEAFIELDRSRFGPEA